MALLWRAAITESKAPAVTLDARQAAARNFIMTANLGVATGVVKSVSQATNEWLEVEKLQMA